MNRTHFFFVGALTLAACSTGVAPIEPPERTAQSSAAQTTPVLEIDCGSRLGVAPFAADSDFTGSNTTINHANPIDLSGVTNPAPAAVYQTSRSGNVTYTIPGFTPGAINTIRLHFAETYFGGAGQRIFNVLVNDATWLPNFDIFAAAKAKNKAYVAQTTATANASGAYVIQFTSVVNVPMVAGIEIDQVTNGITGVNVMEVLGKCLDVPAGNAAPGIQLDLWDCNGNPWNQLWVVGPDGTIRPGLNASYCLDLKNGQTANATPVVLEPCNGGWTQQWLFEPDGTVRGYGGKCLDVQGGTSNNGTPFDYWPCGTNQANQSFTLATYSNAGAITTPPCNSSDCSMTLSPPPNTDTVSLGTVNVYLLWYGNWSSQSPSDPTYTFHQLVPQFIQGLNESSYQSVMTTYYDKNNRFVSGHIALGSQWNDANYTSGSDLSDTQVKTELQNAIQSKVFGAPDTNGVYFLLPSPDVKVHTTTTTTCTTNAQCPKTNPSCVGGLCSKYVGNGLCGYNDTLTFGGANYNMAQVMLSTVSAGLCAKNMPTPNQSLGTDKIGMVDNQISVFAHELDERITQAWGGPGGQSADECNGKLQNTYYVTPNCGGSSCPPAPANVHLNNHDFLVQAQRVNLGTGYCASSYGSAFWGTDYGFGWSPVGDWNYGSYKGECEPGQPVIGVSSYLSSQSALQQAHAILCGDSENAPRYRQSTSCTLAPFGGFNNFGPHGDWDPGSYVDECPQGNFAAGVSQSTNGMVNGLLCCPGTGAGVTAQQCTTQYLTSNIPGADWDWGFSKAQCPSPQNDQYVVGISQNASTGGPNAILCCSP